jgi:multidrug efflux pump subunit AcrB
LILLPVVYLLLTKKRKLSEVKLASEQHKVKSKIGSILLKTAIEFCLCLLIISIILILPRLETGFLPEMDRSIVLDYESPPGTSLEETDRMLVEVEKIIHASRSGGL